MNNLVAIFRRIPKPYLQRYLLRRKQGWRVLAGKDAEKYADKRNGRKYG